MQSNKRKGFLKSLAMLGLGLGLGLGGAKRLSDEFQIDTTPGAGTTVTSVKWKLF